MSALAFITDHIAVTVTVAIGAVEHEQTLRIAQHTVQDLGLAWAVRACGKDLVDQLADHLEAKHSTHDKEASNA